MQRVPRRLPGAPLHLYSQWRHTHTDNTVEEKGVDELGDQRIFHGPKILSAQGFSVTRSVGLEDEFDLIADAAKGFEFALVLALGVRRIFKAPVVAIHHARESGAGLVRIPADGDYRGDALIEIDVEVVGAVMVGVDANFFERFEREWMHRPLWFGARAKHLEEVARGGA